MNPELHLSDDLAVRQLAARFSDACVVHDTAAFRALWAPNGIWEISLPYPTKAEGLEAVMGLWEALRPPYEVFLQMAHSGVVEIDPGGQRAKARWIMQEFGRGPGRNYNNYGLYQDDLVKLDQVGWKFARRAYNYLWLDGETPLPGQHFGVSEAVKRFL